MLLSANGDILALSPFADKVPGVGLGEYGEHNDRDERDERDLRGDGGSDRKGVPHAEDERGRINVYYDHIVRDQ